MTDPFRFSVDHHLPYGQSTGRTHANCTKENLTAVIGQLVALPDVQPPLRRTLISMAIYEAQAELTRRTA